MNLAASLSPPAWCSTAASKTPKSKMSKKEIKPTTLNWYPLNSCLRPRFLIHSLEIRLEFRTIKRYLRDIKRHLRTTKSCLQVTKRYLRTTKKYLQDTKRHLRDTKSYLQTTKPDLLTSKPDLKAPAPAISIPVSSLLRPLRPPSLYGLIGLKQTLRLPEFLDDRRSLAGAE